MSKNKKTITLKLTNDQIKILKTGLDLVRDDIKNGLNQVQTTQMKTTNQGKPHSKAEKIYEAMDSVEELENLLQKINK